jgi:hypothetical protein
MRVPWRPEPVTALQARYAAAVEHLYEGRELAGSRPGNQRQHVFDWADGLRLIVSRERTAEGRVGVHFTASVVPNTRLSGHLANADALCSLACERWQQLAHSSRTAELIALSPGKGIPHFIVWDAH